MLTNQIGFGKWWQAWRLQIESFDPVNWRETPRRPRDNGDVCARCLAQASSTGLEGIAHVPLELRGGKTARTGGACPRLGSNLWTTARVVLARRSHAFGRPI